MINTENYNKTTEDFFKYLQGRGIAKNTFRFYRSDFLHFQKWLHEYFTKISERKIDADSFYSYIPYLDRSVVKNYIKFLKDNNTPLKTINRRLSTIRHLSNYLQLYGYISNDITKNIENESSKDTSKTTVMTKTVVINKQQKSTFPYIIASSFALLSIALITILLTNNNNLKTNKDTSLAEDLTTYSNPTNFNRTITVNKANSDSEAIKMVLSDTDDNFSSNTHLSNKAVLASDTSSVTVSHPLITNDMLIYLTPTSETNGETIFVSSVGNGYFTVSVDKPTSKDIHFNWLATNSKII